MENIYNELYSLSEKLIGEATKVKSEIGKSLAQKLMNEIYSWHEEYIIDVNGLFINVKTQTVLIQRAKTYILATKY